MARIRHVVGIDISKRTLDLALYQDGEHTESFKIENTLEAIQEFATKIKSKGYKVSNTIFCAEETGVYGTFLKRFSEKSKWRICFDSPLRINRSLGLTKGKNDKVDAIRIGDYANKNIRKLEYYQPPRKIIEELRYLGVALTRLQSAKRALLTTKKCNIEFEISTFEIAYLKTISSIEADVIRIKTEIYNLIKSDERLSKLYDVVTSVPGVADALFLNFIIATNEFKRFNCPKKFASYCAVAPFRDQSGTTVNKRSKNSNIGNKKLKTLLHMSSLSCLRNKKSHFYKYYYRKKKSGYYGLRLMNAIKNKIIHTVFACVREMQQYEYR